jgi:aminobenzoyl-glutamate utilization protein B
MPKPLILSLVVLTSIAMLRVDAQQLQGKSRALRATSDQAAVRLTSLKNDVIAQVEARRDLTQQMVDSIFSFSELGFQEKETQRYVTGVLEREGFAVTRGVADIPTSWIATWGSGRPIIALGSDIDGVPNANQTPGVLTRRELVPGAPGHGEGHNAGQAVIVTAALAAKALMAREHLTGTLLLWPGVAEELLATKAYFVRAGLFADVDAMLYAHVGDHLETAWGDSGGSGLVSVEYTFKGEAAHAAVSPWLGRSALDAVELMDIGWNFKREHLRLAQRSHYVITNGGAQPNVVPADASVWYYFRENDYNHIKELWTLGDTMATAASMMTGTTVESRVLGSAWPIHLNRALTEAMHANIIKAGMPTWSDADQRFARAFQRARGLPEDGLATKVGEKLDGQEMMPDDQKLGGASDDIGDISWTVPTAMLNFPSNIPGLPSHHWSAAVAMATPVAHKGATQGAKVEAMTIVDLLLRPQLIQQARDYFQNVQGKQAQYRPFIRDSDKPAITSNSVVMEKFRPELQKHYYDPSRLKSYIEQLDVTYTPPMPEKRWPLCSSRPTPSREP